MTPFLRRCLAIAGFFGFALMLSAMSVVPPSFDELVSASESVVRGKVLSVHADYATTASGERAIKTFVTLRVERVLKGPAPAGETITLVFLGGTVGNDSLRIAGMPTFQTGEREIVFFSGNGHTVCPLISGGHGRYRLLHDAAADREYVAREDRTPLESTADVSVPLSNAAGAVRSRSASRALTPNDFENRISEAVTRLSSLPPAQN